MQIESTQDYDVFRLLKSNREVDEKHVLKLVESIKQKNLLHLKPINVNQQFEVMDGQHRLEAAKILKVPIYYQLDPMLTGADISILNTNKKNWKLLDYLNFWRVEGLEAYKRVTKFINTHNKFPLTTALQMLSDGRPKILEEFKEGKYQVGNWDEAEDIAKNLSVLSQFGDFVYKAVFINAFVHITNVEGFEFERLLSQIKNQPLSFVPCVDRTQYLTMMENLYNYKAREDNRLKFSKR